METAFAYDNLDTSLNKIRLVHVDCGHQISRIQLQLVDVSLTVGSEANPDYVALSYTWSDPFGTQDTNPGKPEMIFVNGYTMMIGANLATFLRTLSAKDDTWYWIDAICIDQSNIFERNEQVRRMCDIYTMAKKTLIWLGAENDNSNIALDFVEDIGFRAMASPNETLAWVIKTLIDENCQHKWQAFIHLMNRSWWRRVWVIQEVVLAHEVQALCGERRVDWTCFVWTHYSLNKDWQRIAFLFQGREGCRSFTDSMDAAHNLQEFRDARNRQVFNSLLHALNRSRLATASDARDNVYAIHGLLAPDMRELIKPDYNSSTEEVCKSLVIRYVEHTGDLEIIMHAANDRERPGPSWVPDWSRESRRNQLSTAFRSGKAVPDYTASQETRSAASFSNDMNVMSCEGIYIDRIDGLGSNPWSETLGERHCIQSTGKKMVYESEEDVFDAILHSCCGAFVVDRENSRFVILSPQHSMLFARGCHAYDESCPPSDISNGKVLTRTEYLKQSIFERSYWKIRYLQIGGRTIHERISEHVNNDSGGHEQADLVFINVENSVDAMTYHRRMIQTEEGYLGFAPDSTRVGDKIYILLGCKTPVVLRAQGSDHQLIGECYVHGIMFGEAMEDLKQGKYSLETVSLR